MLGFTPKMVVHLCDGATDLRKSFTGLNALVKTQLKADPLSGHLFVFTNRTHTRVKAYYWDGTGEVITMKKLHDGTFRWPEKGAIIDMAALQALLAGYEIRTRKGWYRHGVPIYDVDSQQDILTPA